MGILIAFVSIVLITSSLSLLQFILRKSKRRLNFCPICFGVGFTWLWMWITNLMGVYVDSLTLTLLLGGIVVGLAYQTSKIMKPTVLPKLWRAVFIPTGFLTVYLLHDSSWAYFSLALASMLLVLGIIWWISRLWSKKTHAEIDPKTEAESKLEKDLEECCD